MPRAIQSSNTQRHRNSDILYPVLIECSNLVTDEFWRHLYRDLASGKSPRGIYISNGTIHTSSKRGGFSYPITDKAPEVITRELHFLLTTHTSICSRKDVHKKRQLVRELEEELESYDNGKWTSIKRKNIRQMLLVNFAIRLHKKYNLSWPKTQAAYRVVVHAFESKTHTSKDIEYSKGKIRSIQDIEYDPNLQAIVNLREIETIENKECNEKGPISLQCLFENYIQGWKKSLKP